MEILNALVALANSQFGAAVAGGIIGALAGGVPAWFLARSTARASKAEREKLQIFRLYAIIGGILNDWLTTRGMLDEMLNKPAAPGDRAPTQRRVKAIVKDDSETFKFTADDLSLFLAGKDVELVTDCELLARRYASINAALAEYKRQKERHSVLLFEGNSHVIGADGLVTSQIPKELAAKIHLSEAMLESVISSAMTMLRDDTEFVISVAERYNSFVGGYFQRGSGVPVMVLDDVRTLYPKNVR